MRVLKSIFLAVLAAFVLAMPALPTAALAAGAKLSPSDPVMFVAGYRNSSWGDGFSRNLSYAAYPYARAGSSGAEVSYSSGSAFGQAVAAAARKQTGGRVIVYVHGCCSGIGTHIGYAKGLKSKFGINDIIVMYSWPTGGSFMSYGSDTANAKQARRGLAQLFGTLASSGVNFSVVSHSLGASVVLGALRQSRAGVRSVSLLAPDISLAEFRRLASGGLTIYNSPKDGTLGTYGAGGADSSMGVIADAKRLSAFGVTVVDLTKISSGHLTSITSSTLGSAIRKLPRPGFAELAAAARAGKIKGTEIKRAGAATVVILPARP